jgi:PAS domain-containing protein
LKLGLANNKAFLDLTGFSAEEIVGKNFVRLPTFRKRDLPKYVKYLLMLLGVTFLLTSLFM